MFLRPKEAVFRRTEDFTTCPKIVSFVIPCRLKGLDSVAFVLFLFFFQYFENEVSLDRELYWRVFSYPHPLLLRTQNFGQIVKSCDAPMITWFDCIFNEWCSRKRNMCSEARFYLFLFVQKLKGTGGGVYEHPLESQIGNSSKWLSNYVT